MPPFDIRKAPKTEQLMRRYLNDPAAALFFKPTTQLLEQDPAKVDHPKERAKSTEIFKKVVGSLFLDDPSLNLKLGGIPGSLGDATAPLPTIPGFDAADMRNLYMTVFEASAGQGRLDLSRSISWAYFLLWSHLSEDIANKNKSEIKRKLRIMWQTNWDRTARDGVHLAKVFGAMRESNELDGTPQWVDTDTDEELDTKYIHKDWNKSDKPGVYWRDNGLSASETKLAYGMGGGANSVTADQFVEKLKAAKTSRGNVYRNYGSFRICTYFQRHPEDRVGNMNARDMVGAPPWLNQQVGYLTPNGFFWNRASHFPDRINELFKGAKDRAKKIQESLGLELADQDVGASSYARLYPGFPVKQHSWRPMQKFNSYDDLINTYKQGWSDAGVGVQDLDRGPGWAYMPWRYWRYGGSDFETKEAWDAKLQWTTNIPSDRYANHDTLEDMFDPGAESVLFRGEEERMKSIAEDRLWIASSVDPEIVQTSMHQCAWYMLRNPDKDPAFKPSPAIIDAANLAPGSDTARTTDTDEKIWSPLKYNDDLAGFGKWVSNNNTNDNDGGKRVQLWSWDQDSMDEVGAPSKKAWQSVGGLPEKYHPNQIGSAWGRSIGEHKNYNMLDSFSNMWYHGAYKDAPEWKRSDIQLTEPRFMQVLKGYYNFSPIFSRPRKLVVSPNLSWDWTKWKHIDTVYNIEYVSWATWNTRTKHGKGDATWPSGLDAGRRLMPIFEVEWNYYFIQVMRLTSYFVSMFFEGVFSFGEDDGAKRKWLPFDTDHGHTESDWQMGSRVERLGATSLLVSNFYKILISTIHRALYEFKSFQDEIDAIKKLNNTIEEGDPRLADRDSGVVLDNMQCFLLNTSDIFAKLHQVDTLANQLRGDGDKLASTYLFTNIKGPSSNFANLIGFKPESITAFLNLSPSDLAQLQPKIKLFKERVVYDTNVDQFGRESSGDQTGQVLYRNTYEIPLLFDPKSISSHNVATMTAAGGRHAGGGIQEIRFSQKGGQEVGNINEFRVVEIKYFFNSLEDMFINWPRYEIERTKDNKVKSIQAVYPFGKNNFGANSPKFNKKKHRIKGEIQYASAAELFFAVPNQFLGEVPQGLVDLNSPSHAIILELGWVWADLFGKNRHKTSVLRQLNEQKISRAYKLGPRDTDFEFMENGSIKATVTYDAYSNHLNTLEENKLFPTGGIINRELKNNPEYQKQMKIINAIEKKWAANSSASRTAQDIRKHTVAKTTIDALVKAAKETQSAHYANTQLQKFMRRLVESHMVHRVYIPAPFLGQRTKDEKIVRWYPYRNMNIFRRFKKQFSQEGRRPDSKIRTRLDAIKEEMERKQKNVVPKQRKGPNLPWDGPEWPIDFVYFGDLIHIMLEYNFINYSSSIALASADLHAMSDAENYLKHVHFILGSIQIPVIKGEGFVPTWISLCDLPIVVDFLGDYIINNLVRTEAYDMTISDFILGFFKDVLYKYFDETCFVTQQGLDRAKPEITWFELFADLNSDATDIPAKISSFHPQIIVPSSWLGRNQSGVLKNPYSFSRAVGQGRFFSKEDMKRLMQTYETKTKKESVASAKQRVQGVQFCFLGAHAIVEGTYSAKEDKKQNIHHFYIGRDLGPVKKIQFKSEQIKGMSTALLVGGTKQFKHAVDQSTIAVNMIIPRVFNTDVTMVGNTLFETGQTFFVDPVLGTSLGITGKKRKKGFNIIEQTGLGGYYYITKIDTIIAPGRYETVIEGKTDKSASRETVTQASFNPKDMKEKIQDSIKKSQAQFKGEMDKLKDEYNPF
jgi:hypothetical protein